MFKNSQPISKRILLGQLKSGGDCLYATAIARQIKEDYPGCHLTWAVSSMCRSILEGNPHIDAIWEIPLNDLKQASEAWYQFKADALEKKEKGEYDEIFLTQIAPDNLYNFDATIRSSIFRGYPKPIRGNVQPVIRLFPDEVENVHKFVKKHNIEFFSQVILFECSAKSGQSFITIKFAMEVAEKLVAKFPNLCVILSSDLSISSDDKGIIDGSLLSFRENAELTKYCTLLVGCSSGISWISTSDWAKPLPMIQLLKKNSYWFASVVYDYEYWGLPTDHIVEMTDCSSEKVIQCIAMFITEGAENTKFVFHERLLPNFDSSRDIHFRFLQEGNYLKTLRLLLNTIQRNGVSLHFIYWHISKTMKHLSRMAYKRCIGWVNK